MTTPDDRACGASQERIEKHKPNPARPITCDQVSWMLNAIGRYLPTTDHPSVSRVREMQKYALLYEIMEVAHLHFEDDAAQHNGTPPDVRRFRYASKSDEATHHMNHGVGGVLAAGVKQQGSGTNGEVIMGKTTWDGDRP